MTRSSWTIDAAYVINAHALLWYLTNKPKLSRRAQEPYIRLVPFAPEDVLSFAADAGVPEMHDRIIAGLARRLDCPLVTKDASIVASGIVQVSW